MTAYTFTDLGNDVRSARSAPEAARVQAGTLAAAEGFPLTEKALDDWESSLLSKLRGRSTPAKLGGGLAAKATGISARQADYLAKASEDAFVVTLLQIDPLGSPAAAEYALRALRVSAGIRTQTVKLIAREVEPDLRAVGPRRAARTKGQAARHQHPSVLVFESKTLR